MIIAVIFILIVVLDVLAVREISRSPLPVSLRVFCYCIVLLIPILGFSIYYIIKTYWR